MHKKTIRYIIGTLVCIALSLIIEIFFYNNHALNNTNPSQEVSFSTIYNKEASVVNLDINNQYINKLEIEYNVTQDIDYTLKYHTKDLFNKDKEEIVYDIFDDSFHKSVTNLNNQVSNLTIEFNSPKTDTQIINRIVIDNSFHFNFTRTFCIFLSFLLIYSIVCFFKQGFQTEKIHIYFTIVCLILGTIIIVSQPSSTFYSFDDQIHFQDTIDLFYFGSTTYSVGEYHSTNANVANSAGHNSINSIEEKQAQDELFNSGESNYSKDVNFRPTYNKIGYLPMSIGYHFAKLINLPFSICFKIGKLFNLLFYALMMAYAIKIIKTGKRLLTVIALLPTNIFLASEYSYDPAVIIGLTVFFAHLLNLYLDSKSHFDFKTAIIMLASISYACFIKAIYVPFLLLMLIIPTTRFDNLKQSHLVKSGIIAITILLSATFILPTISGTMESDSRGGNTSVNEQLSSVLSAPSDFIALLGNTTVAEFSSKTLDSFSNYAYIQNKANLNTTNYLYILLLLLFFVFFTDNDNNSLLPKQRFAIISANITTILLIWVALYFTFTPVGSNTINGVQSRYFLPLFFPLLISLQSTNIHSTIKSKLYNTIVVAIPTLINLIMIGSSILAVYSY